MGRIITAMGGLLASALLAGCSCTASPNDTPDTVTVGGQKSPVAGQSEAASQGQEGESDDGATATASPGTSVDGQDLGPGGGTIAIDVSLTEPAARDFTTALAASTAECTTDGSRFSVGLPDASHTHRALRREAVDGPWMYFTSTTDPNNPELNSQELSFGVNGRSYSAGGTSVPGLTQNPDSLVLDQVEMTVFSEDAGAGERGTATVSGTITCSA